MKKLYYRTESVSKHSLCLMALLAIGTWMIQRWIPSRSAWVDEKVTLYLGVSDWQGRVVNAVSDTSSAFEAIRAERLSLGHSFLDIHDPMDTGMIGPSMSRVTTLPGHLEAKQTAVNPEFAAVAMRLLVDAGVRPGDRIAVGCTGSFPGLNIAVISAAKAMDVRTVLISSTASSQFGANSPDFMWPDIERLLTEQQIISTRSEYVSLGGFRDTAAGMTPDTVALLKQSIQRSKRPELSVDNESDSIDQRMLIYDRVAGDKGYAAYVNIGGGDASVGGTDGNLALGCGLTRPSHLAWNGPEDALEDCVAKRFLESDVPVVNFVQANRLARQHGLPVGPSKPKIVGIGPVYAFFDIRRLVAVVSVLLLAIAMQIMMRPPRWLSQRRTTQDPSSQPKWMV